MRTLACLAFMASAIFATEPPKGFTAIFNGKDLTGWHGWAIHEKGANPIDFGKLNEADRKAKIDAWTADSKKHWSVKDGELINDGHGAYLATDKSYGDCEFLIEYRTVAKADSGIYMRATPQVQIWDSTEEAKFKLGANKGSGGLWNNASKEGKDPLVLADKPFGEWNSFRILQVGERTSIWLNGKLVVDHARMEDFWGKQMKPKQDLPLLRSAPILLQTHGGEIRWRNIFIREIPTDEANDILQRKATAGMKSIFNGKNLNGWQGATNNYEVKDGAIVCKPGKGGVLYTQGKYRDFTAAILFKLPPGGNNGLGIRYPGKGDGAYAGMTELQILDNDAEKYKKLDNRQYHGSAYGMAAAHRGYLRKTGDWNFQTVTVTGSNIVVELNGTRILDTDLSKVKDFMDKNAHPGKDVQEGHFALLGHNDPVEFRMLMIR